MTTKRILENSLPDEVQRTVLREAVVRYRREIMGDEERLLLEDRLRRLRRRLGLSGSL
jgi:hypothetical protein